jgi:adenylate cyclase
MRESLQEKDRVSLVLGKVVSPQAARNVLTGRDNLALKGERRGCAILYADLRGFNLLGENLAPEALVEALNRYFSLINEAVFKHEGMLDKFVGEAAIAVWGAPVSQEDKELRAVEAALEIQDLLREFNVARIQKNLPSFSAGIGIHAGEVVSGNLGSEKRNDYTIIGPPLEVARKLCAKASPGQIIISEDVYRRTQSRLKVTPLGSLAVSDREEALPIYEVFQFV